MKQFSKTENNDWIEVKKVTLSEADKAVRLSDDKEAKKTLSERIKTEREGKIKKTDEKIVEKVYEENKPALKEGDSYQLIAVDITVDGEDVRGIINCRVNGEHIQVRF